MSFPRWLHGDHTVDDNDEMRILDTTYSGHFKDTGIMGLGK